MSFEIIAGLVVVILGAIAGAGDRQVQHQRRPGCAERRQRPPTRHL